MPFVDINQLGKFGGNLVVRAEMLSFTASRPTTVQWRQYGLADAFENIGNAGGQVVIQQNNARRKTIGKVDALTGTQ